MGTAVRPGSSSARPSPDPFYDALAERTERGIEAVLRDDENEGADAFRCTSCVDGCSRCNGMGVIWR